MEVTAPSPESLQQVARSILSYAKGRKKFVFTGLIGAGKTALIQAMCQALGVQEVVTSPTFALVNEYSLPNELGEVLVYHIDLYRLQAFEEALDIGIEEMLYAPGYCFIEWPSLIENLLPDDVIKINIEILENSARKIIFL